MFLIASLTFLLVFIFQEKWYNYHLVTIYSLLKRLLPQTPMLIRPCFLHLPLLKLRLWLIQGKKKRITHVMINDSGRGEATKKRKTTVSDSPYAASLIMGVLPRTTLKMKTLSAGARGVKWSEVLLQTGSRRDLFHGLDLISSIEDKNSKLQQYLNNAKSSSNYYKCMLDGVEKKIEELNDCHKGEIKNL